MKNKTKRLILIFLTLLIISVGAGIFIIFNNKDEVSDYSISEVEAKAIEIENLKITNISKSKNKKNVTTKIKNNSKYTISNISIDYVELDKNDNKVTSNKSLVEVSLNNGEKAVVSIPLRDYTYTVNITGYSYDTNECSVSVDLEKNEVKFSNLDSKYIIKNGKYEILELSELEKVDDSSYELLLKNVSKKNLGNIVLVVAQLNKEGEYLSVDHVLYNSTLKEQEIAKLLLSSTSKDNTLEIVGYIYDDIEKKDNISVDLKSHNASIVRN